MILMLGLCEEVRVAENNNMNTSLVMLLTTRDADSHLALRVLAATHDAGSTLLGSRLLCW